ncbi:flagellar hook-associated protein FlgK [Sporosarcina sp. E16_3]|uniref:flagellar hook-associated protein FlgK n=1 Tax=Sporosarcina sp. E16_3 TaxID=2789293 RepID=UPI0021048C9E|nr:flagellar hook-associated protein FlgK [Sporosarcina sp. E16_3]
MSTFMGLETSKRGLFTQQSALYTTGHNISNANTLGYSRQRVNMEATGGFPGTGLTAGTMPGFLGTGVQAGSIQRIRDGFVDQQYRQESNSLGYWESRSSAISQMEDVMNEPSAYGLQKTLSEFWQSLQDLAVNPENGGARAVVVERGVAVADSFNYMHKSLTEIQTNLGKEISVTTSQVNSILKQLSALNGQIRQIEPNGYTPNDLYDARDILLDELAVVFPIETSYEESGGRALASAEGSVTVSMRMKDGSKVTLVEGNTSATLSTDPSSLPTTTTNENIAIKGFKIAAPGQTAEYLFSEFSDTGKMKSLMNSYGTTDGKGLYPEMLAELTKMAAAFGDQMNKVHSEGTDINGVKGGNFFDAKGGGPFTAGNIQVSDSLVKDPNLLAASDSIKAEVGNGKNAKKLADVQLTGLPGLGNSTIRDYFQGVIGQLGVNGQHANRLTSNSMNLLGAVEHRRASISSVSLDEEMTDMIRYQQAYNASARMITVVDETLDKIINGMGRAGM